MPDVKAPSEFAAWCDHNLDFGDGDRTIDAIYAAAIESSPRMKMYVWRAHPNIVIVHAESISAARELLPEGERSERVMATQPEIWLGPNYEVIATDSAQLEEADAEVLRLQARVRELEKAKGETEDGVVSDILRRVSEAGSQHAIARNLNISDQYLCDILRRRKNVSPEMAERLGYKHVISFQKGTK